MKSFLRPSVARRGQELMHPRTCAQTFFASEGKKIRANIDSFMNADKHRGNKAFHVSD